MSILIIIIHVVVAIALILIVLLQTGKGADMGAAFGGGGSQTVFGSTGANTFLTRLTTGAAIVFMLTSLALAYLSGHRVSSSIVSKMPAPMTESTGEGVPGAPVQQEAAAPAGEGQPSQAPAAVPPVETTTQGAHQTPPAAPQSGGPAQPEG